MSNTDFDTPLQVVIVQQVTPYFVHLQTNSVYDKKCTAIVLGHNAKKGAHRRAYLTLTDEHLCSMHEFYNEIGFCQAAGDTPYVALAVR